LDKWKRDFVHADSSTLKLVKREGNILRMYLIPVNEEYIHSLDAGGG
jgi:hypothetical protein